jgi:hypothetical protein
MHDDLLERGLRTALQTEADSLPFTITPDELRRRLDARRRTRIGRPGMLLLAAALGVGLLGAGVIAGGWLDRDLREPSPVPSAPIAVAVTPAPSATVLTRSLPTMDAFLAPLEPGRIVRAQAVGPATAPTSWSRDLVGTGSTTFAPVTVAGSYRVLMACLGADVNLVSHSADPAKGTNAIPITCDGNPTARDVGLAPGDTLSIDATDPASWRIAVLAPARADPHADTIATAAAVAAAAGPRLDAQAASERTTPDFGLREVDVAQVPVMDLSIRDAYRIAVSCAGPAPLTYRIQSPPMGVTDPVEPDGAALRSVANTVECDGDVHVDVVHFPFSIGADVWIDAPSGTAWRIAASFEDPPIKAPQDGDGWKLGIGIGPNLIMDPQPDHSGATIARANRIRVVVTCLGGTGVDIVLRDEDTGLETVGSAPCEPGKATTTIIPVAEPGRRFSLDTTQHGAMWLVVTIQQAAQGAAGG